MDEELREKVREKLEESQEIHKLLRRAELLLRIAVVYGVRVKKLGGE